MKRVTIYEVAREANVSLATVSRVINGAEIVRQETRERVEQAIEKLGYKPNAIAQGLALQKTTTIALVIPEASFTYTGQVINGLLDAARILKYNIMLHTITEGITDVNDIVESIIKSRVDGVVFYNDKLQEDQISTLKQYQMPMVVIGNRISGDNVCSVFVDIEKAVCELCDKYLSEGKSDIAIVQDRKNLFASQQMVDGAKKAFARKNQDFTKFIEIPQTYRTSYAYLKEYFKTNRHQLVIANRDSQALACMNAAMELGISIPDQMEVVCVINTKYNAMVRPQLSSFALPSYDLGAVAMRLITKMLNNEPIEEREIELSYLFTPRQTTK
ncbi:MAG: LacI family transcriptional regulator [Erysipelotrichaceae bacterium]|jgi:LacI family transcriptional regulator|nr:LacI family transcriptional regulator [Erysipelotrichaceae bacterium]